MHVCVCGNWGNKWLFRYQYCNTHSLTHTDILLYKLNSEPQFCWTFVSVYSIASLSLSLLFTIRRISCTRKTLLTYQTADRQSTDGWLFHISDLYLQLGFPAFWLWDFDGTWCQRKLLNRRIDRSQSVIIKPVVCYIDGLGSEFPFLIILKLANRHEGLRSGQHRPKYYKDV